jgi:hypothetical protein
MYAFVCPSTTDKGALPWVISIRFRYSASSNECLKQIAFNGSLVTHELHAFIATARVTDHDGDFPFWLAPLCLDFFL